MSVKVDITMFERDTWANYWHVCPNCEFDSLVFFFAYCPNCGVKLEWPDREGEE